MTGALVITGVPTKLGALLIEAAGVNLAAMVADGLRLRRDSRHRPAAGADLYPGRHRDRPPMIKVGVNPWVVHFFAFFLGVFGELTPPTSLVAAVTAKIANASFYRALNRALQICVSLFTLMVGVFVHPELVVSPASTRSARPFWSSSRPIGITFSIQARYADARPVDVALRVVLAAFALVALFVHDYGIATAACVPVLMVIGYWVIYRRKIEAGEPEVVELEAKALGLSTAEGGALGTMS